jgi:hypothetical protein
MMFLSPIAAMAFSIVTPGQSREFVVLMTLVVGILGLIVSLACADAINNLRIHRHAVRELKAEIIKLRLDAQMEEAKNARAAAPVTPESKPASDGQDAAHKEQA